MNKLRILFRVEANEQIGLGHFFRSIALAEFLYKRGHEIYFISLLSKFWKEKLKNGFSFRYFDKQQCSELFVVEKFDIDVFFVDGIIEFDEEYIEYIKKYSKVIFYQNISQAKYMADIYILPSLHQGGEFFAEFPESCRIYQGIEYFTFNKKIQELKVKKLKEKVRSIAVISGGSDPNKTLEKIIDRIDFNKFQNYQFNFYKGVASDNKKIKYPYKNLHFHRFDHEDILNNDFLISSFGVSTYEFLALGMPVISFAHQKSNAIASDYLANKTNSIISLGVIDEISNETLNLNIELLINDFCIRKKLNYNAMNEIDLFGIQRVARIIENSN